MDIKVLHLGNSTDYAPAYYRKEIPPNTYYSFFMSRLLIKYHLCSILFTTDPSKFEYSIGKYLLISPMEFEK